MGVWIYNASCTACSLHEYASHVCIPASGRVHTRALVVGEAPGRNEDLQNQPFVGRAGELLDVALKEAFITEHARYEVPVTNIAKCRPPGNRNPTSSEVETCMGLYFNKELEYFDPIAILTLGNVATEALIGYTGVSTLRGQWWELDSEKERWVMPTWHPAYVNYNGGIGSAVWDQFLSDVCAFANKVIALQEAPANG